MLTLVTQPKALNPIKNPVPFRFTTDKYRLNNGTKAVLPIYLTAGSIVEDAKAISFAYKGRTVRMVSAAAPDDSGQLFTSRPDSSSDIQAWGAQFVTDLKANYYLFRDFDIAISSSTVAVEIYLTAKQPGAAYTITFTTDNAITADSIGTIGADISYAPNYKALLDVYTESAPGQFAKIVTLEAVPDSTNTVGFDISAILESQVGYDLPDFSITHITVSPSLAARRFYTVYAEEYGNTAVIAKPGTSSFYTAWMGGFSPEAWSSSLDFVSSYSKRFLTLQPLTKTILYDQPDFLYCLAIPGFTGARIITKLYYSDGTTADKAFPGLNTPELKVLIVPAGMSQLKLNLVNPAKTIVKYELSLVFFDDQLNSLFTEVRTFLVQYEKDFHTRFFLFGNSLGGMDVFRAYGYRSKKLKLDLVTVEKPLSFNYKTSDGGFFQSGTAQSGFKCSTGPHSKPYLNTLQDFLLSSRRFEIVNGTLIPIVLDSKSVDLYQDADTIYAFEFEYSYAFTKTAHS